MITNDALPKKLKALIVDSEHAFLVRIGTEPRTTETGIANIIPQGIDRKNRNYLIQLAEHLVRCWNSHDALYEACKRDAELANAAIIMTPTGEYRNKLTEINILRMQALSKAEGKE